MVQGQERAAARDRGQAATRECLAQLASELRPEERVGLSPQDPHRAGELAEPAGGVEQDARVDAPRELGEVAADGLAGQRLDPVEGQPGVEAVAAEQPVGERAVPHQFPAESGDQARDQPGMAQGIEERREGPGREGVERVAVRQHRGADPAGVRAEHDLADRPAGVVAHERHVGEAERLDEVEQERGDSLRREVGAGVHRLLMRPKRERRRIAADAFGGQAFGDGAPELAVDENPVHEHDRRAGTRFGPGGAIGELALRQVGHWEVCGSVICCHGIKHTVSTYVCLDRYRTARR